MNLWRVAIDEVSGKVLGKPEAVTTPAPYIGHLSFSSDGRRVAYRQTVSVGTLESLGFDPATEQIAAQRSVIFKSSLMPYNLDLSPDGKSLAFMSSRPPQEDLYVVGVDGTGLRQLTDDPYQDRLPRWSPDGKRIVFYSTRSGDYQIYTMGADGSGLQQLTEGTPGNRYPVWSPDGTRLAIYGNLEHSRIIEVRKPWKEQSPRRLPPEIFAWAWSRDGRRIAGGHTQPIRWQPGIGVYDFDLGSVRWLTESGYVSAWLSDSRRLLCHDGPALRVLDSQTGKTREIVSVAPHEIAGNAAISRDDRKIYFSVSASESEIWLMSLEGESR
jgi:Tol biopolymer transport system component